MPVGAVNPLPVAAQLDSVPSAFNEQYENTPESWAMYRCGGGVAAYSRLSEPAGSAAKPAVIDSALAALPSSVVKATLTAVLAPAITDTGLGLGVAMTLLWVVATYARLTEPVFDSPASLR